MSEQNLDIIIRTVLEGQGLKATSEQLTKVREELAKMPAGAKRAEFLKGVVEGIREETAAMESGIPVRKRDEEAIRKQTEEVKKATLAKQQWKDAVKGLAFEFPLLGKAMMLLTNPATALIAIVGSLVAATRAYIASVDEAATRARVFSDISSSVQELALMQQQLQDSARDFAGQYDDVGRSVDSAVKHMDALNAAMLQQQRIAQQIDDAQLELDLAKIQAGPGTASDKIGQTAAVQEAARKRKVQRELETQERAAGFEAAKATNAELQKTLEARKLPGLKSQIESQQAIAAQAGKDAKSVPGAIAPDIAKVQETITTLEQARQASANYDEQGAFSSIPGAVSLLMDPKALIKTTAELDQQLAAATEELKMLKGREVQVTQIAEEEQKKLADLLAEQAKIQQRILENERIRLESSDRARLMTEALARERAGQGEIQPRLDAAGRINATKSMIEADQAELQRRTGGIDQIRRADGGDVAGFVGTVNRVTGANVSTLDAAIAAMEKFMAETDALRMRVKALEDQLRNRWRD